MKASAEEVIRRNTFTSHRSPPLGSGVPHVLNLLDTAAEMFCVHRDFQTCFCICEKGLAILLDSEKEHSRWGEVKEGLCILGVQALAELDQWQEVLSWVLRQYERPEDIPSKIMQMCILLYAKVGQEATIQEAARTWLVSSSVDGQSSYKSVAELYLLCVLLPLGRTEDARQLVMGKVWSRVFSDDQRQLALEVVMEKEGDLCQETSVGSSGSQSPGVHKATCPPGGGLKDKLLATLRFLSRSLPLSRCAGQFPLRRLLMAGVIVYILMVRLNPALPSSYLWISKLLQLLKQMWEVLFKPKYSA